MKMVMRYTPMRYVDVECSALGQVWRVVGEFRPERPAQISGPPENCHPAEDAEWGEVRALLLADDGSVSGDMSELLERLEVPRDGRTALEVVLGEAEYALERECNVEDR